jgi:signal transduction histidine kinase
VQDLSAGAEPHTMDRALTFVRAAADGTPQLFEWLAKHRDGRLFWVEVNLRRVVLGDHDRLLAIVRDISERKRAEESLRAADERLREQATLVKLGEMAAVVAHEVRNPLAAVRGALQVIGRRQPPGAKDGAVINEIIARLDALEELIKDLLLFARPPQVHAVPVDIMALAKETSALVSQDPTARNVRFEIEGSPSVVMVDPQLLRIVLLNLFLNSTHAIQSTGTIRTSVAVSDGACQIAVSDTGPGIPVEIRDRIFAPFFTTKSRGTGLGLATAKRLVESHRGRISVSCPPQGGTIVAIELPG